MRYNALTLAAAKGGGAVAVKRLGLHTLRYNALTLAAAKGGGAVAVKRI